MLPWLHLLTAEIGTGLKISAVQQLRQLSGGTTDVPSTSMSCPGLTQNGRSGVEWGASLCVVNLSGVVAVEPGDTMQREVGYAL
jgi:hypothetical protein